MSINDKDNEEYIELLEKKNKGLKRLNGLLLFIVIIGVLGALAFVYVYFDENLHDKISHIDSLYMLKNRSSEKYNPDMTGIESYHNASNKLNLISAYGDNQGYHPKVLNFKEAWHGYKYWMTFSPFPNGNEKYENPHIYASNDLINWEVPKGLTNPIVGTPDNFIDNKIYNSDPHIVYNSDNDQIELYYRYVDDIKHQVILYRLVSSDGIKWSKKEKVNSATRTKKDYISPAIIYEDGIYKMWYVDRNRSIKYAESSSGLDFKDIKTISVHYPLPDMTTWHLDVIHTEKGYEMIIVAYKSWSDRNGMNLYYFSSEDNDTWTKGKIILRPSLLLWDNRGIYRSSFIYEDGIYYVYYSAVSQESERGIGLAYGENIENLIGYDKEHWKK